MILRAHARACACQKENLFSVSFERLLDVRSFCYLSDLTNKFASTHFVPSKIKKKKSALFQSLSTIICHKITELSNCVFILIV